MILPRRMSFQLTPLLDLLLIVIFAQFMEVKESVARTERQVRDAAQQQLLAGEQELETRRQRYQQAFEHIVQQQERAGDVLSQVFRVPDQLVEELMRPRTPGEQLTPQQEREIRDSISRFNNARGRQLINELVTYDEIRKRSDVWEVYVTDDGLVRFLAGDQAREFRTRSVADFEQKLFEAYKTLPQPKSLVVILFSYGDAQGGVWQRAMDGLPGAVSRMRDDRDGHNWFEFTILGYNARGPIMEHRPGDATP